MFACNSFFFFLMQTRNALSGTYSAPQRSASSTALLVGDPNATRDKQGNLMLPRDDVVKLRDRLKNEEFVAGSFFCRMKYKRFRHELSSDYDYRREMCTHARILALEEAIDTEWVYMWDKFGGYLLLLLGLTAKAERVQVSQIQVIYDVQRYMFLLQLLKISYVIGRGTAETFS